ncbi:MAG TPA: UDP-N-acetylmuramoyl-tripeptide--D-alanyl-D-alanine ligase [Bdellovibrionota bacterium]|nr:UDP-N-acetylmuramoyl-tripeptide--D-alanyl-D-alanine ligase [Bdellovibrionota bacterium]
MHLDFATVAKILLSQTTISPGSIDVKGVSTDTRSLQRGDLFFALKGPHFDGHAFLTQAKNLGAAGAVVDQTVSIEISNFPLLRVKSPLTALGDLAHWYRKQFSVPVIAITGSNGKTTTKDLIASILSQSHKILATEGNLNNLIGVPRMLFRITPQTEYVVLEMGMNARGEIARLAQIAEPNIGVITNIGHAHLEFLETIEEVAEAKYELWKEMGNVGIAIVNLDDEQVGNIAERWSGEKITFSATLDQADVNLNLVSGAPLGKTSVELFLRKEGQVEIQLPLIGVHNVYNAAAAAAVAYALKIPLQEIAQGLPQAKITKWRSEFLEFPNDRILINDSYNANPTSMEAVLQNLAMLKGGRRTFAILGDMFELGAQAEDFHFDLGTLVAELKIDYLLTFGPLARHIAEGAIQSGMKKTNVISCQTVEETMKALISFLPPTHFMILVKGSRGMAMERIVEALKPILSQLKES